MMARRSTSPLTEFNFTTCELPQNACVTRSSFLESVGAMRSPSLPQNWLNFSHISVKFTIATSGQRSLLNDSRKKKRKNQKLKLYTQRQRGCSPNLLANVQKNIVPHLNCGANGKQANLSKSSAI